MVEPIPRVTYLESDLPKHVQHGFLSRNTTYSLRVDGPFRSRELKNLIRMLTLNLEWLIDDEAAAEAIPTPSEQAASIEGERE